MSISRMKSHASKEEENTFPVLITDIQKARKRETEEDWSSLIGKMEKKKEILSYYYKFLLASVDATRITAIYYFLH